MKGRVVERFICKGNKTKIAKQLNVSRRTVYRWCKHAQSGSDMKKKKGSGRKPKLNLSERVLMKRLTLGKQCKTGNEVRRELENRMSVFLKTVCNTLNELGIHSYTMSKVPAMTRRQKQARLTFAREHVSWTLDDWKKVVFSDETKVNRE